MGLSPSEVLERILHILISYQTATLMHFGGPCEPKRHFPDSTRGQHRWTSNSLSRPRYSKSWRAWWKPRIASLETERLIPTSGCTRGRRRPHAGFSNLTAGNGFIWSSL